MQAKGCAYWKLDAVGPKLCEGVGECVFLGGEGVYLKAEKQRNSYLPRSRRGALQGFHYACGGEERMRRSYKTSAG